MRQTAIKIKAEFAIPADVADIAEFQAAVAKANQLKAYAEEIGIVTSFETKMGNVETGEDQQETTDTQADENSNRATFPAEAMKVDQDDEETRDGPLTDFETRDATEAE